MELTSNFVPRDLTAQRTEALCTCQAIGHSPKAATLAVIASCDKYSFSWSGVTANPPPLPFTRSPAPRSPLAFGRSCATVGKIMQITQENRAAAEKLIHTSYQPMQRTCCSIGSSKLEKNNSISKVAPTSRLRRKQHIRAGHIYWTSSGDRHLPRIDTCTLFFLPPHAYGTHRRRHAKRGI